MKIKSLLPILFALIALTSCDGDHDNAGNQDKHESSFINKRVRFIGSLKTISSSNAGADEVTTTTTESLDIIDEYLVNGAVISNGTATLTSISSNMGDISDGEVIGRVRHIANDPGTYRFSLALDGGTATLINRTSDDSEFITLIIYENDKTGVYTQVSDMTHNNLRVTIEGAGTFEILD